MTCQRQTAVKPPAFTSVGFQGVFASYSPEQISQDMRQGDAHVTTLIDDFAGTPLVAPRIGDRVLIPASSAGTAPADAAPTAVWIVQGVMPTYEGDSLIGHMLMIRGGGNQ